LPPTFATTYAGDSTGITEASLTMAQVPAYLALGQHLQQQYRDQIEISVGFEVDYLSGFEAWTRDFLAVYGPQTQESILSVHFMPGAANKTWAIDLSPENFGVAFADWLDQPQQLFQIYYQTVLASVQADLGPYAPQRIGHMSLVRKYQDYFGLTVPLSAENLKLVDQILDLLASQQRELDLNLAGLYKPFCNDFYPGDQIIQRAQQRGIPLIYGSDAHDIVSVGRGQHLIKKLI